MNVVEGIGPIYRQKLSKVINAAKGGITSDVVCKTLGVDRQEAGRLLSRWSRAGWLQRIKRGFYVSIPVESSPNALAIENPWVVVSNIYSPGYIGGFSAIKHWNLSEQIFETTTFFTTKKVKQRQVRLSNIRVNLKTIKFDKIFGTKSVWVGSSKILVSDPSRTMVDLLDDPHLAGSMTVVRELFEQYLESEYKNVSLLIEYASKLGNKVVFKRLGFLLELISREKPELLEAIQKKISKGYSKFDPAVENAKFIRRWNLSVPIYWQEEYGRKK